MLCRYAFPGNISELRDLVERAAVQAGEAAPQLNADLFWFATQASLADYLCALCVLRGMGTSAVNMSVRLLHEKQTVRKGGCPSKREVCFHCKLGSCLDC